MLKARIRSVQYITIALCIFQCTSASAWLRSRSIRSSVVKIYSTVQYEDYVMPWQGGQTGAGTGTGFIISGKRIMSNAHVISNARFIQVQKDGDPNRYNATVSHVGHDCDLAVLAVDDETFFENTNPLQFANGIPTLNDEVFVMGFPMGGARLSITKGIVSRVDYSLYSHSGVDQHLVIQVDAAINPGNSGGPIVFKNKVVGVAFQGMTWADNIGYGIPLPIIEHFLKDIEDGFYDGYPELGINHFNARNSALRKDLKMPEGMTGIIVSQVDPIHSSKDILKQGDVITSIDGYPIANDGTIKLDGETIDYAELIERKQSGDSIKCSVWRDGNALIVNIPLITPEDPFIYRNIYDKAPLYFIKGGLVFCPLTREYIRSAKDSGDSQNAHQLLYAAEFAKIDDLYKNRKEFVVLTYLLKHSANTYSEKFLNGIVETINGMRITELNDLQEAFKKPENGFHIIRFMGMDDFLVMETKATEIADEMILRQYQIQAPMRLEDK